MIIPHTALGIIDFTDLDYRNLSDKLLDVADHATSFICMDSFGILNSEGIMLIITEKK